ncbi:MAG TPA: hypothetical protein VFF81_05425 [Noviherbaspirillum sp.]|nr:hypothetical protein [Noviherbaspirillum sp.]
MTTHTTLKSALITLLGCAALQAGPVIAADAPAFDPNAPRTVRAPETKEQLERRLGSVATLIESSSAAKQIESSGNADAQALRLKAGELRKQAEAAYNAGDYAKSTPLLDQAAKMMFEAVRIAAPEQITAEKAKRDFDNRMESVKALLAAQKRITTEKKLGAKGAETSNKIEAQIKEAAALAAAGKMTEGRALLDQVYVTTKTSIESMRDGDTLVRSLNFATKEEEYHYEVDRYETHKMLVKVLLDEKRAANPNLEGMVQKYLDQAAALRSNAEAAAGKRDYEGAVKLMEDSTKELVRAIRGAGVYIPG